MSVKIKIASVLMYKFGILKCRYKTKSLKLLNQYYSLDAKVASNTKPVIIVMIDGKVDHGGLGDRIHGILSMYMLSIEYDMDFKINFTQPFDLINYFVPNFIDWVVTKDKISYNLNDSLPYYVYGVYTKYEKSLEYETNFHYSIFNKILKKKSYKQYHFYTNTQWAQGNIYSYYFHSLFKPTNTLLEAIKENKALLGDNYIAIVLRFQQQLGDFVEDNSPKPLNEDEQNKLINKCIDKINSLHSNYYQNTKILVTSDSGKFLNVANQLNFVYIIPGKVVHLSYTTIDDFNLHLKSFLDLIVLSEANKIILLATDNMYHSGFAKTASLINNKQYEEIFF